MAKPVLNDTNYDNYNVYTNNRYALPTHPNNPEIEITVGKIFNIFKEFVSCLFEYITTKNPEKNKAEIEKNKQRIANWVSEVSDKLIKELESTNSTFWKAAAEDPQSSKNYKALKNFAKKAALCELELYWRLVLVSLFQSRTQLEKAKTSANELKKTFSEINVSTQLPKNAKPSFVALKKAADAYANHFLNFKF